MKPTKSHTAFDRSQPWPFPNPPESKTMEANTDTTKKGRGRQGAEKQTMAKKPKVIAERIDDLVKLHAAAKSASEKAQDAITKAAEDSGYLASAVKKLVTARAGDKFEEKHREIEQQAELFDEVGE